MTLITLFVPCTPGQVEQIVVGVATKPTTSKIDSLKPWRIAYSDPASALSVEVNDALEFGDRSVRGCLVGPYRSGIVCGQLPEDRRDNCESNNFGVMRAKWRYRLQQCSTSLPRAGSRPGGGGYFLGPIWTLQICEMPISAKLI